MKQIWIRSNQPYTEEKMLEDMAACLKKEASAILEIQKIEERNCLNQEDKLYGWLKQYVLLCRVLRAFQKNGTKQKN